MSWLAATIHVLDFEGSRGSGVVEYGVATLAGGKITAVRTRLCAPTGAVDARESAVHGLRENDVAHEAAFGAEREIFSSLRQTGLFAAHHMPVERSLLQRAWPVPGAAPDFAAPDPAAAPRLAEWGPWLDTCRIYESIYPGLTSYQLMDLIQAFTLTGELVAQALQHCPNSRRRPHCALYDALAAALLLARLAREPDMADVSLAWLLTHSTNAENRDEFRQGQLSLDNF